MSRAIQVKPTVKDKASITVATETETTETQTADCPTITDPPSLESSQASSAPYDDIEGICLLVNCFKEFYLLKFLNFESSKKYVYNLS